MLSQFQINFIKEVQQRSEFRHFLAEWLEDVNDYARWHAMETNKRFPIAVLYYTKDDVLRAYRVGVNGVLSECSA